jgi:hypothetical protein
VADSCRCLTQVATENPSLSANFPFENSVPSKCACQVVVVARPRRSIIIVKQANGCFWRKAAVHTQKASRRLPISLESGSGRARF